MNGAMKRGSLLSISIRLMLPGSDTVVCLPLRNTRTSRAIAVSRYTSTSNSRKSPFSVPMSMSWSLKPYCFASVLNFIPIVMSFGVINSSPQTKSTMEYISIAKRKLTSTPPIMINSRCHAGFARNSQGCSGCFICSVSILSSIIPAILQYPPNGNHPTP